MILFGSRAIKYYYPDFPRECKDWDFLVDRRGVTSDLDNVEYKHIGPLWKTMIPYETDRGVLSPARLLTLKASHLFYDNQWEKHMEDAQFLISKGHRIHENLFLDLADWWKKVLSEKIKRSNLNQSKEAFFKNKINYVIDHDMIHTLIHSEPAYKKILTPGSEVLPSEWLWYAQPESVKDRIVREEVYVMAWERGRKHNYREAYQWMLKRFIQRHAPIWEMIYIIENYNRLKEPEFDYINHINNELRKRGIDYDRTENDRERVQESAERELQHT